MFKGGKLSFKNDADVTQNMSKKQKKKWNILIVDDEKSVHDVTMLALANFEFENKQCNFIVAHSAQEAKEILQANTNIALALIDVVMETETAGLDLVNYIRNDLKNNLIRIILRTGQPGQAPEEKVIHDYDINDYKSKSDLTTQRLYTSVLTGLRAYRDMITLEKNRQGLKKIISSTSSIEKMQSLEAFLSAVLEQLGILLNVEDVDEDNEVHSFIAVLDGENCIKISGTGEFENIHSEEAFEKSRSILRPLVLRAMDGEHELYENDQFILYKESSLNYSGIILYLQTEHTLDELDKDLIRLFLDNAKVAYENTSLSQEIDESQKEIIFTLGEIAEQRSQETGHHVKRVALYSKLLAEAYGLSHEEVDRIFAASPMHDIGKMAIPDSILLKPSALTDEEMEVMKTHSTIGYNVLKSSQRKIMQMSAIIAKEHHEKWDGTGYPDGLKGEEINIAARIVAIADVFDALGSKRIYKDKWELDDIFQYIKEQSGTHFDPKLVDLLFENMDEVLKILQENKDTN